MPGFSVDEFEKGEGEETVHLGDIVTVHYNVSYTGENAPSIFETYTN